MEIEQENKRRYYSDKWNVTNLVEQGKTVFFECRELADAYAYQKRSYVYELISVEKGKTVYGFGVPS